MNTPIKNIRPNHLAFIDACFATSPWNATAAYKAVYTAATDATAMTQASQLLADPVIKAEVERRRQVLREQAGLTAGEVLRELLLVSTADPRELSEHYVGACRYCYGENFKYQRTPSEYDSALAAYLAKNPGDALGLMFPMLGGVGYTPRKEPHVDCPECYGEGVGYEVFKDTRKLSAAAARLFQGVEKTRNGLKIRTRSQDRAIELVGQTLGLFKTTVEMSGPGGVPLLPTAVQYTDEQLAAIVAAAEAGAPKP